MVDDRSLSERKRQNLEEERERERGEKWSRRQRERKSVYIEKEEK